MLKNIFLIRNFKKVHCQIMLYDFYIKPAHSSDSRILINGAAILPLAENVKIAFANFVKMLNRNSSTLLINVHFIVY